MCVCVCELFTSKRITWNINQIQLEKEQHDVERHHHSRNWPLSRNVMSMWSRIVCWSTLLFLFPRSSSNWNPGDLKKHTVARIKLTEYSKDNTEPFCVQLNVVMILGEKRKVDGWLYEWNGLSSMVRKKDNSSWARSLVNRESLDCHLSWNLFVFGKFFWGGQWVHGNWYQAGTF